MKYNFFYGWWIAFTALVVNAVISAPAFGATGLWINSLETEFGWSRTQLSIAFSLGQLEGSIAAPFVGYMIDKIGGKKVACIGAIVSSIGFLCLSQTIPVTESRENWLDPAIFYISYVTIMFGVTLGGWIPMTVIINNWFSKHRSLAMSIGSVGFSIGTFAIVPLLAILIESEYVGWKFTALGLTLFFPLLLIPITKIIKNTPEEIGEVPDGKRSLARVKSTADTSIPMEANDFSLSEALREKVFWYLAVGHGASAMLTSTMMVHLILAFKHQGISLQTAAFIWGIAMGIGGVSQILGGFLGDRTPKHIAVCLFGCIQAIGVSIAVLVTNLWMAVLFSVVYGIGFGARAPITTSMRGDYFGRKSFGKIMGVSAMSMMLMTMFGPIFAGRLFDLQGDYKSGFLILAAVGFAGSLIFLLAKKPKPPQKV
ncbi:MFS transporter [Chloroflexi bacterium]|nr:MFS transporter [Chloroflexota bacterium]